MEELTLERAVSLERVLRTASEADVFSRMGMLNALLPDMVLVAKAARERALDGDRSSVRVGQVWIYSSLVQGVAPVVHVITRLDGDVCESTSVFTDDGSSHEGCIISGAGLGGVGISSLLAGGDGAGTWTKVMESRLP